MSLFSRISHQDYHHIKDAIHCALCKSLQDTSKFEPQLVANLAYYLPKKLNSINISRGLSIKSGSVYVHQTPKVKCNNFPEKTPASVEIGDVLFVVTHVNNKDMKERRALLLQVKKFSGVPTKPDNQNQHHLYQHWSQFVYVRSGPLNGHIRHANDLDMSDGTQYLLLPDKNYHPCLCCHDDPDDCGRRFPHCCCDVECYCRFSWRHGITSLTAKPTDPLSHYRCFQNQLVHFILGNAGKVFVKPADSTDNGWNQIIEDLIIHTSKRANNAIKRAGDSSGSRQQGVLCFMNTSQTNNSVFSGIKSTNGSDDDKPPEGPPTVSEFREDADRGGISVIEFIVSTENA